jgi:hypothetical protein
VALASADAGRSARATRAEEGSHAKASDEAVVHSASDDCEVAT